MKRKIIGGFDIYDLHTIPMNRKKLHIVYEQTFIDKMEADFCLECTNKKCNGHCKYFKRFSRKIRSNIKEEPKTQDEYYDLFYKYVDEVIK